MKSALVLAYESLKDLPKNYRDFDILDVYGFSSQGGKELKNISTKVNYYNGFFDIANYNEPKFPYNFCFIRHPDPWGEPRNWMQPIAALAESLSGELTCEFWFPSEIIAFNYLLQSILGNESIRIIQIKQIDDVGNWKNYQAKWSINQKGVKNKMLELYQKNKIIILQNYYKNIGKHFNDNVTLTHVESILK